MLNVVMLRAIMLDVVMLSVIMLNDVAPSKRQMVDKYISIHCRSNVCRPKCFRLKDVEIYNHQLPLISGPGNTKGGSITKPLTSCLTGLESAV